MTAASHRIVGLPAADLALLAVVSASLIFAFAAPLKGMLELWNVSPMYSHGYTVPIVSAYLLYSRRDRLRALQPSPARLAGAGVIAVAAALLLGGNAGGIQAVQQLGFLVAIAGVTLLLFGWAVLRTAMPAIGYLLLMVPVWDGLTEPLHQPFQIQSAAMAVSLLRGLGVPAHLDGVYVSLPGLTLEVARTCSGVNYLVAVLALGLPLSFIYLSSGWRRAALIGGSMAIAALSNGLRVALIGVLAYLGVGSPLHGPFHVLHGLFVAGIGYVVLFVGVRWLADRPQAGAPPARKPPMTQGEWRLPRWEFAAVTIAFLALGSGVLAHEPRPVPIGTGLDRLPGSLGEWQWDTGAAEPPSPPWWSGADARLKRRYSTTSGASVTLYVEYFEAQSQGREIAGYQAADLHRRSTPVTIADEDGSRFEANLVRAASGETQALFWYEVDRTVTTPLGAKLRTLWSTVAYGRSNGAALMIMLDPLRPDSHPTTQQLQALGSHFHSAFARLASDGPAGAPPGPSQNQ